MTNPAAPRVPQPPGPPDEEPTRPGVVSDPDAPNPWGPDAPNVRDDDPAGGQRVPDPPPPTPTPEPLDDIDFAPDEA